MTTIATFRLTLVALVGAFLPIDLAVRPAVPVVARAEAADADLAVEVEGACSAESADPDCAPADPPVVEPESAERIVDYNSDIVVDADGGLTVIESIAVVAMGEQIKRGIYRDFPTLYARTLRIGEEYVPILRTEVPFEVVSVQRDGQPEPFHTESRDNGLRVYIGAADAVLPAGPHSYRLQYKTARQLGFFADHDELYWNVTGNGWVFPIDRASASVVLPADIPRSRVTVEGWTGVQGSQERQLTAALEPLTGIPQFVTTAPLHSYEGLTILVTFPKGFVREPTAAERRAQLLHANPLLLIAPGGLLLVVLYYAVSWWLVGRDPTRGTIIPLFEPPLGLEAASLRYVGGMGYDERCFTAALVGLAVKGWARIADADGTYTVSQASERHTPLGPGEKRVNAALLSDGSLELVQKNHGKIRAAIRGLREALKSEYDGKLFRANRRWLIPGIVLSVLVILACGFSGPFEASLTFAFMMVWLTGWTFACVHLVRGVWRSWRGLTRPGAGAFERIGEGITAIVVTLFALPFLLGEVFGLFMLMQTSSVLMVPVLLVMVVVNFLFLYLLKQPTLAGRDVMDKLDGFKMYLTTAEGAELAQAAPQKTLQLYERLLPYAVALEVENQWTEQFGDELRRASQGNGDQPYRPMWFSGNSFNHFGSAHFASALSSSLSTSIASSSSPPGSRSGSSGGGSGGGGGGGGGGGW
jgi:uncharacterized membrane protein YgcG